MRRALPHAELCIVPAAGHAVMNDQPDLFRLVALDFLALTDRDRCEDWVPYVVSHTSTMLFFALDTEAMTFPNDLA